MALHLRARASLLEGLEGSGNVRIDSHAIRKLAAHAGKTCLGDGKLAGRPYLHGVERAYGLPRRSDRAAQAVHRIPEKLDAHRRAVAGAVDVDGVAVHGKKSGHVCRLGAAIPAFNEAGG